MGYTLIDELIKESLRNAVARYGIEGTEQKIRELYALMPVAKQKLLDAYRKLYLK